MDLKQLKAKGAFVPKAPIPKEIEWTHTDPETGEEVTDKFTVHVKKQSFGSIERLFMGEDDRSKSAAFIAQCIRLGDGQDEMSYEDAYQLDAGLAAALVKAINEVNSTGNAEPKN